MVLSVEDRGYNLGREIEIETDGRELVIRGGEIEIRSSYESPLELLYIISWMIKSADKTKLVFKDGETEFVRMKRYNKRDSIRLGACEVEDGE